MPEASRFREGNLGAFKRVHAFLLVGLEQVLPRHHLSPLPTCHSTALGFLKSQSNEIWIYCIRICSAMVGVPHRSLLPSLPTTTSL